MKTILRSLAMLSLCCWMTAGAAELETVDLGAIELGKIYSIPDMCAVTGTFTAPATGTLLQDGVPDVSLEGVDKTWAGYGENGQVYSYQVEEGKTYVAACDFVFSGGNVSWQMQGSQALAATDIIPAEGSALSTGVNGTGEILLQFNAVVSVKSATMTVNGKTAPLQVNTSGTVKVGIGVRGAMEALYADGTLSKAGNDPIVVTLDGVADSDGTLYNGDGTLTLNYVSAPKAVDLVSTDFAGRKLKSYYAAGDPEGVLTFTFDGPVMNLALFTLSVGAPEVDGGYYYEEIAPAVDGEKVTVDLTGKLRELNPYIALSELPYVAAKLSNVRDLQGYIAAGDGEASGGSYNFSFLYDYIEPVTVSSEFTPASGASLEGVDKIEIWFNNADKVTFDGVAFTCADAQVVVAAADLDIAREGTEVTINVAVPEQIKGKKGVVVTLHNLVSLDGYDHTAEIKAMYDAWVVTLVSPIKDGGSYATTGEDDFVFTLNQAYGYMRYDLYNGEEWVYGSWLNEAADGTYTAYNGNWPLYEGMDNRMLLRAYDNEGDYWNGGEMLADTEFHFTGLTEGFTYSDVKFVGIDPEPNTEIVPADDFCFTLTFDGLVSVSPMSCVNKGFGMTSDFAKIEAVDPEETTNLSSVWKLYPESWDLTGGSIDISVFAYDIDGKLVEGNMGGGEYDFLQFSYMIYSDSKFRPVNVFPSNGENIFMLSSIEVSNDTYPVGVNYNYDGWMPYVSDRFGTVVYTFQSTDIEVFSDITGYDEDDQPIYNEKTSVLMTLQNPIWEDGSYMLFIPEGFFTIGSQFEDYYNEEVQAMYTIGFEIPVSFISIEPGDGEQLLQLDYIMINTTATFNPESEEYITLYSFNTWSNVADWSQWSPASALETITEDGVVIGYKLLLEEPLTEDGEYSISVPDGVFVLDGQPNPWTSVTFTIGLGSQPQEGTVELTLSPAPGSTVHELDVISIDAEGIADAMINWDATITITDENLQVVRTISGADLGMSCMDWDTWTFLGYNIDLTADPITADGVYTVDLPNALFEFWDMSKSAPMTAVYTVDSSTGVSTVLVETASRYEVYGVNGVKVLSTDSAADLGKLHKGLYIINGKKVMVK